MFGATVLQCVIEIVALIFVFAGWANPKLVTVSPLGETGDYTRTQLEPALHRYQLTALFQLY